MTAAFFKLVSTLLTLGGLFKIFTGRCFLYTIFESKISLVLLALSFSSSSTSTTNCRIKLSRTLKKVDRLFWFSISNALNNLFFLIIILVKILLKLLMLNRKNIIFLYKPLVNWNLTVLCEDTSFVDYPGIFQKFSVWTANFPLSRRFVRETLIVSISLCLRPIQDYPGLLRRKDSIQSEKRIIIN